MLRWSVTDELMRISCNQRHFTNFNTPRYQAKLAQRPVLTQSITTAILFATGDVMAQQAVEKRGSRDHNFARTGRMALYGGAVFGPGATLWYQFLQRKIQIPRSPNLEIVARVATDQCVFASTNLFVFLSSMALMEGSDPGKKLQDSYATALKKNWMLWPAVQVCNFKFVPLEHRVLVVNLVSLGKESLCYGEGRGNDSWTIGADEFSLTGWNCYLSFLNSAPSGAHVKVRSRSLAILQTFG